MKRQTAKLVISLILLMTILTGFKAIKINTDQKSTIEDLNKGAIELERYKKELLDKSVEID